MMYTLKGRYAALTVVSVEDVVSKRRLYSTKLTCRATSQIFASLSSIMLMVNLISPVPTPTLHN